MVDLAELDFASLEAIQGIDPSSAARTTTLGTALDFTPAIPVVSRLVAFFKQIPKESLGDLPDVQRDQVLSYAAACWKTIQSMLQFNPAQANAAGERESLINQLKAQFADTFGALSTVVAYLNSNQTAASEAEHKIRELLANANSQLSELEGIKAAALSETQRMLGEVRRLSAESGVSQQATYFAEQAQKEGEAADKWQTRTYWTAAALGGFALLEWLVGYFIEPATPYQAVQFGISKVLIFSTIAFLLFLSARTLMAHRHNEVVNKHRQNALLTFNALADAAVTEQTREVVLTHASACIYAPQDSGFTKPGSIQAPTSLVELAPRLMGNAQYSGAVG